MRPTITKNAWIFALLFPLTPRQGVVRAQEPQEVHPYTTECLAYGCFTNWYCTPSTDLCTRCPKDLDDPQGTTEDDCRNAVAFVNYSAMNASSSEILASTEPFRLGTTAYYTNETAMQLELDNCVADCVQANVGEDCSDDVECDSGRSFCNYYATDEMDQQVEDGDDAQLEQVKEGVCTPCKEDIRECLDDPTIASPFGVEDCVLCDVNYCIPLHYSVTTEIHDENDDSQNVIVPSNAMQGAPSAVGQGPLVECSNLIHSEELTCVDGGNSFPEEETRQEGKVCLIREYTKSSYFVSVVNKCAALGGVAAVFFQQNDYVANNETWTGSLSFLPTTIPSVVISYDDGERWERELLGQVVKVNTTDVGDVCIKRQFCNDDIPCVGSSQEQYCDFKWGGGSGGDGGCQSCPVNGDGDPDPIQCFFATGEDGGRAIGQKAVESCASTCASSLTFPDCKFCPKDISGFDFGIKDGEEKCRFCPENDVLYPDKEFGLFGEGVKCWHVQKFFETVDVNAESTNCQLAQMMNYVCGCSGAGYAGASSDTKKAVLAWLPRIMAILSFLGSFFIIYDTAKCPEERRKVMNQLLIGLSAFDLLGSMAYAFTTLPIPENHAYGPIYGAKGNDAACTAQGFFIQMGTISAYLNVSLAVYYFLIIKYGWDDRRIKKIKWALFLCPMVVGFTFAFAGIPYYDSLNLWCNNAASYWPDIPVAIAIGLASVLLVAVCWDVYSKEQASSKWRGGAAFASEANQSRKKILPNRTTLTSRVFWQSFFYLLAFYLTWPAYLGLQYAWAGGNAFTNYGLILTAATLVPLQGFWNMLVYIRPRYGQRALESIRRSMRRTSETKSQWLSFRLSPSRPKRESGSGSGSGSGHTSNDAKAFASQDSLGPEKAVIPLPTDQDTAHKTSVDQGDKDEEEKQEE